MTKDTKAPGERSRAAGLFSPSKTGDGAECVVVREEGGRRWLLADYTNPSAPKWLWPRERALEAVKSAGPEGVETVYRLVPDDGNDRDRTPEEAMAHGFGAQNG